MYLQPWALSFFEQDLGVFKIKDFYGTLETMWHISMHASHMQWTGPKLT